MTIPAKQQERWLLQAQQVAAHVKANLEGPDLVGRDPLRFTFGFDNEEKGVDLIKVEVPRGIVTLLSENQLAGAIFILVLGQYPHHEVIPAHGLDCLIGSAEKKCGKPAIGGLKITLYPAPTVQQRYGRHAMLSMVMDLPTCEACLPHLNGLNLLSNEQWGEMSKIAQQRNKGILPMREQTVVELCPFDDPDYVNLRRAQATKSQPAQAAPQPEGAGHA